MTRDSRGTQRGKILALLTNPRGSRVPLPEIAARAAQYPIETLPLFGERGYA